MDAAFSPVLFTFEDNKCQYAYKLKKNTLVKNMRYDFDSPEIISKLLFGIVL